MRVHLNGRWATYLLTSCLWVASRSVAVATTATWTNTANGVVDYWTNAANWSAGQYPGQDNIGQNAFLTNRVNSAVYKAIVDGTLPNALGTVEIKNLGTGGEAWVIVTNSTFAATNVMVRNQGRLEIDAGGIVTNAAITMDGTNGQILVNSGGGLFSATNLYIGSTSSGTNNSLTLGDNARVVVTGGSLIGSLIIGAGGSTWNQLLVPGTNVTIRTFGTPTIGAGSNNTALFTGEGTLWDFGSTGQQGKLGSSGSGTRMIVSQGSLTITNHSTFNIGAGGSGNWLIITNGGRLYTKATLGSGSYSSNNTILVTGGNSRWDLNGALARCGNDGGSFNRIIVDQGGTISNAYGQVGGVYVSSYGNMLLITNGGRWYVGSASTASTIGLFGTNNWAVVTGSNSLWDLGTRVLYVGQGTVGTCTNVAGSLRIDNGGVISNGAITVGGGASSVSNTLVVTNGGQLVTSTATSPFIGNASSNNTLIVTGSNSMWLHAGSSATYFGYGGGVGNVMRVENSGIFTNSANQQFRIGNSAATTGNTLIVSSGGQFYYNHEFTVGYTGAGGNSVIVTNGGRLLDSGTGLQASTIGSSGAGNSLVVDGSNSLWLAGGQGVTVGSAAGANGNTLTVSNGGVVTNAGTVTVGNASNANDLEVVGTGSRLNFSGKLSVGGGSVGSGAATGNVFHVGAGAVVIGGSYGYAGYLGNAVSNLLSITDGGQAFFANNVYAGENPSNSFNNVISVANGGLLETATSLYVNYGPTGPCSGNYITNAGGIYQFSGASPSIILGSNGVVYLTSGTLGFRAQTNVDVFCNQSGKPFDSTSKMVFTGANAFRLDNATNLSANQTYVFDTGTATNFFRLDMVNGATRYRGLAGNTLTIGANGQMYCSNTAAAVDLAFTNNGLLTLVNSTLTFATNATLNGTLAIDMNNLKTTNNTLVAANLTLGPSSILQMTGTGTNAVLIRYTGARSGKFGTENTPANYRVSYGALSNDQIVLLPNGPRGTAILFR